LYDTHEHLIDLRNSCKLDARGLGKDRAEERELMEGLTECPTCGQELDEDARRKVLDA